MTATRKAIAAGAAAILTLSLAQSPAFCGPALHAGSAPGSGSDLQLSLRLCADLEAGWRLNAGESLFSALGAFRLTMQDDGNLVIYTRENKASWQSKTYSRVDDIPVAK